MMKSQLRQFIDLEPSCITCIIQTLYFVHILLVDTYTKCNVNNLHTRIKVMAISLDLSEILRININSSFFFELTLSTKIQVFIRLFKKSTRQCPKILIWIISTTN